MANLDVNAFDGDVDQIYVRWGCLIRAQQAGRASSKSVIPELSTASLVALTALPLPAAACPRT